MTAETLVLRHSYLLDQANFLNALTGDEFYRSRHPEAHERWAGQLSLSAAASLAEAVRQNGSAMLGPALAYVLSTVPGFEAADLADLLARPGLTLASLGALPQAHQADARQIIDLFPLLLPAVRELESLGFRRYWEAERAPLIDASGRTLEQFLAGLRLDLGAAVTQMLGRAQEDGRAEPIELFLATFASPHGMKLCGPRYVSDVRFKPEATVRIAIHEMFHPPYVLAEVCDAASALIADPLFQGAFAGKDPRFGYETEDGFLEENVVEAMELHVSRGAGLIADPIGYLLDHDGGSHKLSVVLLKYFALLPKVAGEPFGDYFRRLTSLMPVGNLTQVYESEVAGR
jgi:hypothetical protein